MAESETNFSEPLSMPANRGDGNKSPGTRRQNDFPEDDAANDVKGLADSIPQLVWMARPDGWLFWYNRRWYEYTGTTPEQMAGWGWQSVHDPAMLPKVMDRWQQSIRSGEAFDMEFPLRGADGNFRWFLTRVCPLRDAAGEIVRWYGTNTDITGLKDAEQLVRNSAEKLRQSEDKLRIALDAAHLGVWDWDLVTGALVWSERCKRIFGLVGDAETTYETFLAAINPEDRSGVEQAVANAIRNKTEYSGILRVAWPDGTPRWVSSVGRVFADSSGKPVRMAGVAQDITERHQVEERVRQSQKLESLGLLAGGVAHDFNNLLTGIMGGASIALELTGEESALFPVLRTVLLSSERAAELTRQMLAYSGKGQFVIQLADLSGQVRKTLPLVEHFVSKKIAVRMRLAEDLPPINADISQIQQVIMNLLTNAAEAIGDRIGTIEITTGTEELNGAAARMAFLGWNELQPGTYVTLKVRDSGSGMDEATQAKIFDPFFTTKSTGRGLGLAAIQGIVRGHQGAIQVASKPGEGTLFQVFFPAAAGTPLKPRPGSAAERETGAPSLDPQHTVLVVDDEEIVRRVARAALALRGYKVLLAECGKQAVEIFRSRADEISLILLDLSMPGLSGKECLPLLRAIRRDFRVVICSGFNEVDLIRQFEAENISGVIQKPYTAAILLNTVAAALKSGSA